MEKVAVQSVLDHLTSLIGKSLAKGEHVCLRGFGSFVIKTRAEKTARNIAKNTSMVIPAHNIPYFRPSKSLMDEVKNHSPLG